MQVIAPQRLSGRVVHHSDVSLWTIQVFKSDDTAKLTGMFQRNGVWYARVMISLELRSRFPGSRSQVAESLKTSDYTLAKVKATIRRATHLVQFEQVRRELNALPVERITPEMAQVLAERVTARILATDELLRTEPKAASALLEATITLPNPLWPLHRALRAPRRPPPSLAPSIHWRASWLNSSPRWASSTEA